MIERNAAIPHPRMDPRAVHPGAGGHFRWATEFSNDFGHGSHGRHCSDNRYDFKGRVAKRETDDISMCCHDRYMIEQWARSAIDQSSLSQAEIARRMTEVLGRSIDRAAVNKMHKGTRNLSADEMLALARITGVTIPEGSGPITVPLIGYVAAGAVAHFFDDQGEFDQVEAPPGANNDTRAVEIRGDSLGSIFDRWLVFYDERRSPITSDLVGKLCVVGLDDGRIMIKRIRRSKTPGLFHLESNVEATITDVSIEWAAMVKNMVPR
jgi:transcriptional regulator with XRE-family HTH domain